MHHPAVHLVSQKVTGFLRFLTPQAPFKTSHDMNRQPFSIPLLLVLILFGCQSAPDAWTEGERQLIRKDSACMRVLTVADPADSLLLRTPCAPLQARDIQSPDYRTLCGKMVATVTSPEQDGVGIAGPQVGILRRIVAVQRVDKEGEPFEVYPNIRVTQRRGELEEGREGCLSVPQGHVPGGDAAAKYGMVARSRDIDIQYTSPCTLRDTTEHVQGFAAVIFQHECDHLDGILFTDHLSR